ncbi:NCS2 family permease [uncultured Bacteroides sp.]|jgi:AGZA family xanthine/uracil permease-like MFS transporter|uniref:NCS2 family permease n=1 Tax=uncultured Bacteroides sp. TaxID=162156 RepID=UPI0025FF24CC|nr:NCS2 family permease [uncultured Bacteroides sp.]
MNQKKPTPAAPKRGLLQRLFGFDPQTMTLKKEIIGGITTFFTMAYILAVNPAILSETGMDSGALFTSTALAAIIATLIMSLYAKLPFVLAPGMGLNAFFAYTIVLLMGYTWQFALTAVFLEGLLFILFTVTGLRQKLVDTVPSVMHHAISAGIGLFLAFLGLKSGGVIVDNPATLITLGDLTDPGVLLTVIGLIVTSLLLVKNISGAFLIGILLTALIGIALGVTTFKGIVSLPPSIAPIFLQFQWSDILSVDMFVCVITLLFTDMFDTIGTVIGVSQRAGMVDEKGNVKNMNKAFMSDAIGTTLGSIVGSSTVTTFVESAAGITAGGRSGLTSFTAVICFALALFFSPLFIMIPPQATASVLVLVGLMMTAGISRIDFTNYRMAVPCFVCMIMMPFTNSIANGILLGFLTYVTIAIGCGKWKDLGIMSYIIALLSLVKFVFLQ